MATQTTIIAQNEQELLYELVKNAYDIKKSDFSEVGKLNIYNKPLQSDRAVSFDGYSYTREDGIIKGLNLPQQLMLLHSLSKRFGKHFRHLTLRENFDAAYSPDGRKYKENVLTPFWVYTGEMIRKLPDGYTIHRVNDVDIVTATPAISEDHLAVEDETQPATPRQIRQYKAGPVLQTKIPTKNGYFTDFKDIIPVDSEIIREIPDTSRRGYWNGQHFENNLSAVRCYWGSDECDCRVRGLYAVAYWPLYRGVFGVLGIGTDTPLNK